jgi:uncharacterized membrane protein
MIENPPPLITNDAVVLGILMTILGLIFITSSSEKPFFKFYGIVPSVLLCYFIPALFNTFNIISGESSSLYIASRYLLPASLVLTLSINFAALKKLGSKAIIMFFSWNFRYNNRRTIRLIHCR